MSRLPTIALGLDGWVLRAWRARDAAELAEHASNANVWRNMSDTFPHPYTLAMAEHQPHKAGDIVFNEGDIGSSFHILISGEVVVEKTKNGTVVTLAKLVSGECFGEMALVGGHLRSATVRALRDSVTMRFDRERVDAYPDSAHVIYRNIARILAGRLDESSEMLADLVARSGNTDFTPL